MTVEQYPTRVILNFAHRCSLRCEWCYVPFGGLPAKEGAVTAIIDRVAELNFQTITIGGGDPFQYSYVGNVICHAKGLGLFVHVDTHGKSLRQSRENLSLVSERIDLIGLPLDGASADAHDRMRSEPGHYELVMRRLEWLKKYRGRLKINTIVSAANVDALSDIAAVVRLVAPGRWSIYQYWPLGPAGRVVSKHALSTSEFCAKAYAAAEELESSSVAVEVVAQEDRRATYPIVHHDGTLLVHAAAPGNDFHVLGSIFDETALDAIASYCRADRPHARSRYVETSCSVENSKQ